MEAEVCMFWYVIVARKTLHSILSKSTIVLDFLLFIVASFIHSLFAIYLSDMNIVVSRAEKEIRCESDNPSINRYLGPRWPN